jgi:uncharacterized protein (TIGR00288 family)
MKAKNIKVFFMKDLAEQKKIVVLIDADNAQLSKVPLILSELSSHGHIIIKRAYGDWSSPYLKKWKDSLNELAVQPIQQFAYTTGKNSTDASMIIDAMDLLYTDKFDAFALVSSDSDFTKLASRLKESEVFVFGFGEHKTPISFRNACDDFIFTENLKVELQAVEPLQNNYKEKLDEVLLVLQQAWQKHSDDDGWVGVAVAGQMVKRLHPDFDPRSYGVSKMSELVNNLSEHLEIRRTPGKNNTVIVEYRPIQKKL